MRQNVKIMRLKVKIMRSKVKIVNHHEHFLLNHEKLFIYLFSFTVINGLPQTGDLSGYLQAEMWVV